MYVYKLCTNNDVNAVFPENLEPAIFCWVLKMLIVDENPLNAIEYIPSNMSCSVIRLEYLTPSMRSGVCKDFAEAYETIQKNDSPTVCTLFISSSSGVDDALASLIGRSDAWALLVPVESVAEAVMALDCVKELVLTNNILTLVNGAVIETPKEFDEVHNELLAFP